MGLRQNAKFKDRNWSDEALKMALENRTNSKVSLRKLSKIYNIPKSTLAGYINGVTKIEYRYGGHSILTSEEENIIAEWLKEMARKGYPRSGAQTCAMAKHILDSKNRKTVFKNNLPKKNWWYAFLRRHPNFEVKRMNEIDNAKKMKDHPFVIQALYGIHLEFCGAWGVSLPVKTDEKSIAPVRGSIFVAVERDSEVGAESVTETEHAEAFCESILNGDNPEGLEHSNFLTEEIVSSVGFSEEITGNQTTVESLISSETVITENIYNDNSQSIIHDLSSSVEIQKSLKALESAIPEEKLALFHSLFFNDQCNDPLFLSWKILKEASTEKEESQND